MLAEGTLIKATVLGEVMLGMLLRYGGREAIRVSGNGTWMVDEGSVRKLTEAEHASLVEGDILKYPQP